jgi:hypothetical protein
LIKQLAALGVSVSLDNDDRTAIRKGAEKIHDWPCIRSVVGKMTRQLNPQVRELMIR